MNIMHLRLSHYKNCERYRLRSSEGRKINLLTKSDGYYLVFTKTMDWRSKRQAKDPSRSCFSFYFTIFAAYLSFCRKTLVTELNGADVTLSIKVLYLLWPSHY